MKRYRLLTAVLLLTLLSGGCSTEKAGEAIREPVPNPATARVPQAPPVIDPAAVYSELARIKANEAGQIMILMYHVIGAAKESDWAQTADNFRRDLHNLYSQGYSLISLKDLVENEISTPAGRTPLVMTFDDGTAGHFRYIINNDQITIDPDCAVGILLDFADKHPEFGHTATFFINERPFGQAEYWKEKLAHLVELGFDLGNHTLSHAKLNKISDQQVQKELAGLAKMVQELVPDYTVDTLALPHGLSPAAASLGVTGSYEGYSYNNVAVLRVGANPVDSPNTKGFDPLRLPRIQASTGELTKWLNYFQKHPEKKYISDGEPKTVAIPEELEAEIDQETLIGKKLLIWK